MLFSLMFTLPPLDCMTLIPLHFHDPLSPHPTPPPPLYTVFYEQFDIFCKFKKKGLKHVYIPQIKESIGLVTAPKLLAQILKMYNHSTSSSTWPNSWSSKVGFITWESINVTDCFPVISQTPCFSMETEITLAKKNVFQEWISPQCEHILIKYFI